MGSTDHREGREAEEGATRCTVAGAVEWRIASLYNAGGFSQQDGKVSVLLGSLRAVVGSGRTRVAVPGLYVCTERGTLCVISGEDRLLCAFRWRTAFRMNVCGL
ncbi:unnamed protein product [Calypogeia fissa]